MPVKRPHIETRQQQQRRLPTSERTNAAAAQNNDDDQTEIGFPSNLSLSLSTARPNKKSLIMLTLHSRHPLSMV